jgi:hypothetical protein
VALQEEARRERIDSWPDQLLAGRSNRGHKPALEISEKAPSLEKGE